jgi:acyl transferase domain-containing protein/acyl carrier protein
VRNESTLRTLLAAKLAARLGIDPSGLDPRESFSQQGLDSVGATALIAELSAALGRELSPTLVWAHPTIEALARHLSGGDNAPVQSFSRRPAHEPIAIVGMACRFPGAPNPEAFWRMLCEGVDATGVVPPDRWDADALYDPDPQAPGTINTRRGAFLGRVDGFDPLFFGISPREAVEMDPQQRLALELAWEALEDAGLPPRSLAGTRTGVFAGAVMHDYADLRKAAGGPATSHTGPGTSLAIIPNRISYALGLRGPSLMVDTACSASLVAVHLACQSLRDGECAVALAGGVNVVLSPAVTVELTKFGGLSGDGRCKAFDARADGFARGEGGGFVVLKPLSRALADGDPIYALIRGSAVNNDGASNGLTAPSPRAQVEVLADAYARAGVDPSAVQYVEAHGTGTPLGDPIEARALAEVLGPGRDPDRPLRIGSVKTNIAHQEAAAGIAGLLKLALAIQHREIPPSLHFQTPNPDIPFDELRLRVVTALEPWPAEEPALGGVSSFGWGGTNCHMVVQGMPEIRTAAAPSMDGSGKVVFVFSGMGSQWAGMGRDLLRSEPLFRARLEQCERLLRPWVGWSLIDELVSGNRWAEVEVTLPVLFALQVALADLWRSRGVEPDAVVGHSCGEIAAARVAGALSLEEGLLVAVHYSRALGKIEGRGGIGVVALPPEEVRERISGREDRITVAGWLSPSSTTVAGETAEVDALVAQVKAEGRFAARVATDVAAHTAQLDPYLPEMREALRGLAPRRLRVPMISTVTGERVDELDADYWTTNLREPVLFSSAVEGLLREGHTRFVQIDAHPILATPLEQCSAAAGTPITLIPSMRRGEPALIPRATVDPDRIAIVPLSARSPEALADLAEAVANLAGDWTVSDLGHTAALRRSHHEYRVAVIARRAELAERLREAKAGPRVRERGGVVFAFSGQGPQWRGMGRQLLAEEPVFREAVERCDDLLAPHLGGSILERVEKEEDALDHTDAAQPALFALQVGLAALWRSWGVTPAAVVGHSVGEVAAAYAAGVLSLEEAARVVALRGRSMEPAKGQGRMAAVELPEAEARAALEGLEGRVWVAAVNGPAATVLAGEPAALEEAIARLKGATCRFLRVDYAFHGPNMEPFGQELEAALAGLRPRPAAVPLASTVTGAWTDGPDLDAAYWRRNVREPVLFARAAGTLVEAGHDLFLEIGPHPVLSVAISQALDAQGREGTVLASLRRGRDERETMLEALGALYTLGFPIDWRGVFPNGGRLVPLPTYPFQRQRYWFDPAVLPLSSEGRAEGQERGPGGEDPVERLLAEQLDAFNRMVALQLDAFGRSADDF